MVLAVFYLFAAGRSDRNAHLIDFKNDLKDAQLRLLDGEGLRNRYPGTRVFSFTNTYAVGGTNYYCELAGENEWFIKEGRLAITTNQLFLWIDKPAGATR